MKQNKVNNSRFKYLMEQYKQDSLSQREYQELLTMLADPGVDESLDQLLSRYWVESESAISPDFTLDSDSDDQSYISSSAKNLRNEIGNDSLSAEAAMNSQLRRNRLNTSTPQHFYWGIAASLLLLVGLFFYISGTPEFLGNREIVYTTGYGERLEVELNDGSSITLNANSELRWREQWRSSGSREAILKGEAFFEVEKQNGIPFTVNTDDVAVEVLGTSFNVDSRKEKTAVYLEEGKVNLKLKDEEDPEDIEKDQEVIMKPGDQVKYNTKEKKIEILKDQDLITAASWKKNVLNFKNKPFSEVLEILRDIYGQSFECTNGDLLMRPMVIGVPYADWEAVKQALELSLNIEFQKINSRRYKVKKLNN